MANRALFQRLRGGTAADTFNEAGGAAYQLTPEQALAQYAMTGCLNSTFYTTAEMQLDQVLSFCEQCEPRFVAQVAIYARRHGHMKDMPALLTAWLSVAGPQYLPQVFGEVIDNGKMLRNFVQILRSGAVGRQSLGTRPKKLVQQWLISRSPEQLLAASVGQEPSLRDLLRMVHPKPQSPAQAAMFGYFAGKPYEVAVLPTVLRQLEAFKADGSSAMPKAPFQLLTALPLTTEHWQQIAAQAPWQMTRMNLNTFARHGVYENHSVTEQIANRLRSEKLVRRSRVLPYQLMTAYSQLSKEVPTEVREALQDALDIALENVPMMAKDVVVMTDVSGSMHSPITGYRNGSTSVVRCVDAAALVAAALVAKNRRTRVLPFDTRVHQHQLNPRDSVLTNAKKLAGFGGGGTDCALPLAQLNKEKARADFLVFVSDNESWIDTTNKSRWGYRNGTAVMREWERFKSRNPRAKLVCIDIQPYATTQAQERNDILNIGGFSDAIFTMIERFANGELSPRHWVAEIERIEIS